MDSQFETLIEEGASKLYELGKTHLRQELSFTSNLLTFIDSCNFTCDQLHELFCGIEDLKGSDYDDGLGFDDSDRSDELREYQEGQS